MMKPVMCGMVIPSMTPPLRVAVTDGAGGRITRLIEKPPINPTTWRVVIYYFRKLGLADGGH